MPVLLGLLLLAACGMSENLSATVAVAASVGSIATIHRSPADAVYSFLTGRDCSIVRLDEGKSYCRPVEPRPDPPEFCTRSLGTVNCWLNPQTVPEHPVGVADGPSQLTVEQEENRVRTWP